MIALIGDISVDQIKNRENFVKLREKNVKVSKITMLGDTNIYKQI